MDKNILDNLQYCKKLLKLWDFVAGSQLKHLQLYFIKIEISKCTYSTNTQASATVQHHVRISAKSTPKVWTFSTARPNKNPFANGIIVLPLSIGTGEPLHFINNHNKDQYGTTVSTLHSVVNPTSNNHLCNSSITPVPLLKVR